MRGLLYRRHQPPSSLELHQLLLPNTGNYRALAIKGCHQEAGHQGSERSRVLLSERFWWPGMARELQSAVAACRRCQRFKQKPETAPLMPVHATYPLDLVHVDHLGLEREVEGDVKTKVRVQQVLVVTDHFTRYARAFCVSNRTARTTAKTLVREYFLVHGVPARLLSDRGGAFDNKLVAELCAFLNVNHARTSAYHPQTNGQCERFNRTLIGMLGALEPGKKADWPDHLNAVTHAYNSTLSLVTGYSPYYLMYGRRPRMPVDLLFPTLLDTGTSSTNAYVADLKSVLTEATQLARQCSEKEAIRQKHHFDRRADALTLWPGDEVLLRCPSYRDRRKIADKWEDEPYIVLGQLAPDLPVYRIQAVNTKQVRQEHRNRLTLIHPAPRATPDAEGEDPNQEDVLIE